MDDDFLGFLEKKLDTQIKKHEQQNKHTKPATAEPDDDLTTNRPILTKRVAMLLEGNWNKKSSLGESKKDAKDREKLQKQLNFNSGKRVKMPREKVPKDEEAAKKAKVEKEGSEPKPTEKKLVLSKKQLENNLHLFRGAKGVPQKPKVPERPSKSADVGRPHKQQKHDQPVRHEKERYDKRPVQKFAYDERYREKSRKEDSRFPKKADRPVGKFTSLKYKDESDDSAMEVRDMHEIDEENEYAAEMGIKEEEEYNQMLALKKQYNNYNYRA